MTRITKVSIYHHLTTVLCTFLEMYCNSAENFNNHSPGERVELSEGAGPPLGILKEQLEEVCPGEVLPLRHRLEDDVHVCS